MGDTNRVKAILTDHWNRRFPHNERAVMAFIVAHRGTSAYAPENTLKVIRRAIEFGADFVEIDLLGEPTKTGCLSPHRS